MKFFLLIRNYWYSFLLKKHGEAYAKREYKYMFGAYFVFYHMALIGVMGILQFRLKLHLLPVRRDFFSMIYNGIMLFSPYFIFLYIIFKNLPSVDTIDIEESLTPQKKRIFITYFILGMLLMFLAPYLISIV